MKHVLAAALVLMASAFLLDSASAAPRKADAGAWLWGLLGFKEPSGTGIAARNRDYVAPSKPAAKSQPVYNGLGAGTDHGEYMSAPPQQKDKR